jgi:SsrA-binding protein
MGKKQKNQAGSGSPTIENRRARFDYAIGDTIEVGIVLTGPEVKSVRDSKISLAEGYVRVEEAPPSLWLHGVTILEYGPAGSRQPKADRTRKLLAHRREILKLARQVDQKGMTIVPLKLYFKNGFAKLLIGVGKGRSKSDKRDAIGQREARRDIDRAMSRRG